jgi:Tol biopolymer transport system component
MRKRMRGAISRAVVITVILGASAFTAVRARLEAAQSTGAVPERFGLGVFTTEAWDFFVAFTPDQRTAYFGRANGSFSYFTILETQQRNGRWSPPETAPFSGRWSDADPHVSPDGSKLFFISNRPLTGDSVRADYDIWVVDRQPNGSWSAPRHLPAPVNLDGVTEWSPSVASNGNLYFGAVRPGGKGGNDLYVARWNGTVYGEPENLGDSINTARGEVEPWIAPDESYMIFSGQNRTDGLGGFDLYVAERRGGVWEKARILPPPINSVAGDFNQSVSPDGKWLYFSSTRSVFDTIPKRRLTYSEIQRRLTSSGNGLGDIYRVPMSAIIK